MTPTYDTPDPHRIMPNYRIITGSIAFDSSYPTGGESMDLTGKFATLELVLFESNSGYLFQYDYTNKKVKVFTPTNQHLHTITVAGGEAGTVFVGIASDANDAALSKTEATARTGITGVQNASAAAGAEVANTTDLSALTDVRFVAYGTV